MRGGFNMPKRRERTPDELAKENEKLRKRVERLTYERRLSETSLERWAQALKNTLSPRQLRRIDEERERLIYDPDRRPQIDEKELTWEKVANRFRWTFESLANRPIAPIEFREVVLPRREGWIVRDDAVDWWAVDEMESRVAEARRESWNFRHESRKGIQQTAEMLWEARGDVDATIAVWLSAFLHDREQFGYDTFEYALVHPLEDLLWSNKQFRNDWHHAMKNLAPWQLISAIGNTLDVKTTLNIVKIVAANAAVACGSFELVHFIEQPRFGVVE